MISAEPLMAFSGVRSSWLMLARNSLLAWLAPSARSFSFSYLRASSESCSWLRSRLTTARRSSSSLTRRGSSSAFGGGALGDLHPAAVDQLGLAHALAAAQRRELLAHGELGLRLQLLARDAGLEHLRLQPEE